MADVSRRVRLARYAAMLAAALARRIRGGSGLVISGRILMALAPASVRELAAGRHVTLVSGTNGKTSITALTAAALGTTYPVTTNRDGANTPAGGAGPLAAASRDAGSGSDRSGDASAEGRTVLELDEGWIPWAVRETRAHTVVLSNLSRDQLSRHHEVGSLSSSWRAGLAGVPLVVANADDPNVVWPALAAQRQVWVAAGARWTADAQVCPACGGRCLLDPPEWHCESCDLRRPEPDWWLEDGVLCSRDARIPVEIDLPGRFNLGNAALALATADASANIPLDVAAPGLKSVQAVAGRYQRVAYRDHELRVLLAKNPAGWLELLDLLSSDDHPVVLLLNAEGVDGRDPSWLYDVSFTSLRGRTVLVQGRRATDLLVRLQHDDVDARQVDGAVSAALEQLPPGRVDVVGNYTAFRAVVQEVQRG